MKGILKKALTVFIAACFAVCSLSACNGGEKTELSAPPSREEDSSLESESYEESESTAASESSEESGSAAASESSEESESTAESESSEESTAEPADPAEPLTPIPENFGTDPADSYFDNALFLGYSVMMHFGRYIGEWKMEIDPSIMGDVTFCAAPGVTFYSDRRQTPNGKNSLPLYKGQAYNFKDLPAATGCNTMYIGLMGSSELQKGSTAGCVKYAVNEAVAGILRIQEANPDVKVVILSSIYVTEQYKTGQLDPEKVTNENLRAYNNGILEYCNKNGIDFIDVSSALTDGYGCMPLEYASDGDYHIKKEPFKIWINILRDYARAKNNGTWKNIEVMPELGTK